MRKTFEDRVSEARSLLDVLLILKQKTMQDTHVSTLVYLDYVVKRFDGKYGIWACRPFPLDEKQGEYQIQAYYFSEEGDSFVSGNICLVVFTDLNFLENLQSGATKPLETGDEILHSIKYGVMVSLPGTELTASEREEILDF